MVAKPNIIGECIACEGPVFPFGIRNAYTYGRCANCMTIQLVPMPSAEQLTVAYTNDYAKSGHYGDNPALTLSAARPFYRAILEALQKSGIKSGRIIDVGCGWGGMFKMLRAAEYDALGVDFDSVSLEYCRHERLPVAMLDMEVLSKRHEPFDAAILATVFEHLAEHREMLRDIARLVRPGGRLIVLIPTAHFFGVLAAAFMRLRRTRVIPALNSTFVPPWHTSIFSLPGFRAVLRGSSFQLERIYASPSGTAPGLFGLIQRCATIAAICGFRLFGERWPIVLNHIFVCRREET